MPSNKIKPRGKHRPRAKLTAKQQAFVAWYCSAEVACNGTQAARLAGYGGSDAVLSVTAQTNLRNPAIVKAIEKVTRKALAGAEVTIEAVLRELSDIKAKAKQEKQYAVAAKCVELHGKYLKMFTERIEHVQTIEDVSTEQLVMLLREIVQAGNLDLHRLLEGNAADHGLLPHLEGTATAH